MIVVYQIRTSKDAPTLVIHQPFKLELASFTGEYKAELSDLPFVGETTQGEVLPMQFYNLAPGVLVLSEESMVLHDSMYYTCTMGTEWLSIETSAGDFRAINPVDFLPAPDFGTAPCRVDKFYTPLFRIEGKDPSEIYCVSGFEPRGDDFKYNYDRFHFRGLEFEEIWRESEDCL